MSEHLYTCATAAPLVGKAPVTVRQLARKHGIGTKLGKTFIFTEADLDLLRAHNIPGRPPKVVKPRPDFTTPQ